MPNKLPYLVERMTLGDIDQVMAIERVVFAAPWSARAYRYEITKNAHSTMLVVRKALTPSGPLVKLGRLLGLGAPLPLLGYAGLWLLADEAHICTIAVHPQWQGQGFGELLLISLLEHGLKLGASRATLEVRVSNHSARALYEKYGFEIISRRKGYYTDNKEDAYIMTTPPFETAQFQVNLDGRRLQLYDRLRAGDAHRTTHGHSPGLTHSKQSAPNHERRSS
jgi:ribosomal-protein-alanine N-acetyltransferase